MTLNDFIDFSKAHGRSSARLLTNYKGSDIYVGFSTGTKGRMSGYPLLMKEQHNKVVALPNKQVLAILRTLPDDE
ncbi:MAG: hypothetical protein J6Y16_05865 [Treponema sp.]|nr:hypothetical protein [Treponema sp.]